jgi:dTDP-4-amino-4,6-dideoxygalactose transaminase
LDHDKALGTALRAFSKGDLFVRLRQQPSSPLMRVLLRRLKQSAGSAIAARVAIVEAVTAEFPELERPGIDATHHTHWLFPMMTSRPEVLMRQLWACGFDATCGASNLVSVKAPAGRAVPVHAERLMEEVLYLPLFPSMTRDEVQKLAIALRQTVIPHERSECRDLPSLAP